jgi:hypothetical protein
LGRQTGWVSKNLIYVFKNTGRQVDKPVCSIRLDVSVEIMVDWVDRPVGVSKNLIYVFKNTGRQVDKPVCSIRFDLSVEIMVDWVDRPVGCPKT